MLLKESEQAPQGLSMSSPSSPHICKNRRMISDRVMGEEHIADLVRCVECERVIPDLTEAGMLSYALLFSVVGMIASVLHLAGVAAVAVQISWVLYLIGIVLVAIHVIRGRTARNT